MLIISINIPVEGAVEQGVLFWDVSFLSVYVSQSYSAISLQKKKKKLFCYSAWFLSLSGKGFRCPLHCLLSGLILVQCENSICFQANETNCSYQSNDCFQFTGRILALCLFRNYSLFVLCILFCVCLRHYVQFFNPAYVHLILYFIQFININLYNK